MTFAYDLPRDVYLNVREAANSPYRGLTALVGGKPYLVIDKEGDHYILEGEDGDKLRLQSFAWSEGTELDSLVAASRLSNSPFLSYDLVHHESQWILADGEYAIDLEEKVAQLESVRFDKKAYHKLADDAVAVPQEMSPANDMAFQDETKWLVTPDGEVLMEDPSQPVPNHLALVQQQKGKDYIRGLMMGEPQPIGLQGTIRDGNLNVGGYLMSDMSEPPRHLDPTKTFGGGLKVHHALQNVSQEAQNRGIPVNTGAGYNVKKIIPGQGVHDINRGLAHIARLSGSFFDHITGDEINFHELDHFPADKTSGQGEYWELQGEDGQHYTLLADGTIQDAQNVTVGTFEPYAEPDVDEDRYESDWYPDFEGPTAKMKTAASFEYQLPPHGLHLRTHQAMKGAGLAATVHYPPGIVEEYPEGYVSQIPGNGMRDMMISADYGMENPGQNLEGVPVQVETEHDPSHVTAVFDELGGRDAQNYEMLPDNVRSAIDAMTGKKRAMTEKRADDLASLYTDQEKKAITCPECGSHTLRAFNVNNDNAEVKCLTCGNEFAKQVFHNPQASVKEALQYPVDPEMQTQIIGLMHQIAEATDPAQKQQLQQQLEQLLGGSGPAGEWQGQIQQNLSAPLGKSAMQGYETPDVLDQLRSAVIQRLGLARTNFEDNTRINSLIAQAVHESGAIPHQGLQSTAWNDLVDNVAQAYQAELNGRWPDTIPEGWEDYYREAAMDKGSPYPSDSYKNAPDHTPKGQKKWPKEVNAVYNACMREGNGKGDTKEEKESSCAAIAWAQYEKSKKKDSKTAADGEGKYSPGTRVQMVHPKYKGSRGSITEYKGKHPDLDEEKYSVLLDSGDKVDDCMESHFKKIKSAKVVDNSHLTTSTNNHFLESMIFVADSGDDSGTIPGKPEHPKSDWDIDEDYDPEANDEHFLEPEDEGSVQCGLCSGQGQHLGDLGARSWYRCRNCGMEFSQPRSDESERWAPDGPEEMFGQDKPSYSHREADFADEHLAPQFNQQSPPTTCPACGQLTVHNGVCTNCGWQDPTSVITPTDPSLSQSQMVGSVQDSNGTELREGNWYILHGSDYKVPDVIKIVKIKDSGLTAHFETDKEGNFPLQIESSDLNNYRFDPYERSEDPIERDEQAQKSASGWSVEARRSFSPKEQRELVEENMEGRARNYDKLNLSGTHYEARDTHSLLDRDFLWGE